MNKYNFFEHCNTRYARATNLDCGISIYATEWENVSYIDYMDFNNRCRYFYINKETKQIYYSVYPQANPISIKRGQLYILQMPESINESKILVGMFLSICDFNNSECYCIGELFPGFHAHFSYEESLYYSELLELLHDLKNKSSRMELS